MNSVENILEYYVLTNKLKDVIRSGWKKWHIKKQRLESVAEHVYGTCMLATAIWAETLPSVNLAEVLLTLAIHETEEILIGDMTPFDKGYDQKAEKGRKAVQEIFKNFISKEIFITLLDNFEKKSTPEAKFAYKCDKLECTLQSKLYDEQGFAKLEYAEESLRNSDRIKKLQEKGVKKVSSFFILYDRHNLEEYKDGDDDMFLQISKYVEKNSLLALDKLPKETPAQGNRKEEKNNSQKPEPKKK